MTSSDYGVAERSVAAEGFAAVALGIYELATGRPIHFVDLSRLRPGEWRFVNDLAVDREGNAYASDSMAAAILRVTPADEASVFLADDRFRGEGFNLNGIQVHPDGFLLVVKKSDGALFRVPPDDPRTLAAVRLPQPIVATDGLVLARPDQLLAIANRTATVAANLLVSSDGWRSARIAEEVALPDTYATTGVVRDGRVFVSHGWLHLLPGTVRAGGAMRETFHITEVARLD